MIKISLLVPRRSDVFYVRDLHIFLSCMFSLYRVPVIDRRYDTLRKLFIKRREIRRMFDTFFFTSDNTLEIQNRYVAPVG